jgi:hypothetical protein
VTDTEAKSTVELDLDSPPRHSTTSAPIGQRSGAKNNNNKRINGSNNINISKIKSNSDSNSKISRAKTARPKTSRRRYSAAAEAAGLATARLSRINPLNRQTNEDSRSKPTLGRRASVTVPIAAFVEDFRRRRRRSGSSSGGRIRAATNAATGRRKSLSFLSDSCRRDSGATSWSSNDSAAFSRSRPFFPDDGGGGSAALMNKRRGMKGRPAVVVAAAGAGARRSISTEVSPERGSSSWGFGQPSPRGQAPATDDYGALYERGPSR